MSRRDSLILASLGLIEPLARRLSLRIPPWLDVDLVAAGHLGLVQAANTYLPGSAPFSYWARIQIRRHMVDEIRRELRQQGLPSHDHRATAPRADVADLEDLPAFAGLAETVDTASAPLAAAIEGLTALQQHVIELMYEKQMSLWQIRQSNLLDVGWRQVERAHLEALESLRYGLMASCGAGGLRDYISVPSPQKVKDPAAFSMADAIDELGEIDKKLDRLTDLVARRTQLHLMLVEGLKLKPEAGAVRQGIRFSVTITAQSPRRFVSDKPLVVKYLGLPLYLENDTFGVGKADELLSAAQRATVIGSAHTGPRTYETLRIHL